MKRIILTLPILLFAACASRPPKKIVIVPAVMGSLPVDELANVRRPEEVRAYRFGRYGDPGSRMVMHEAHPVYRIERPVGWNLRPDGTSKTARAPASAPVVPAPADDAVVAEINKQKAATKVFTEEAVTLNQRLSDLKDAVTQTKQMAEQQLLQHRDIAALKNRLNAVEKQHASKSSNAAITPPAVEENW